ncbi:Gfo/Idh/MocA family oxidoreductase [Synechococcus sp. M16CYN]|uniref:Gfo/Idh/MocA family protein n=1 Tax=Synechococcus sp. M16CYN TaxID=3103139 RepID=UPI00333E96DD
MFTQPIGVAIAGLGFGEKVHLPALESNPDLKAVALWHPRRERLDLACTLSGLNGYDSWDALVADPDVDAVIIATPPAPRFDLALQALHAGKHLLLEKPIALHVDQAMELQRLALQQRLSVAVDYEYRAVPLFMQAERLLRAGAIGTPWLVKLDWLMSSRADAGRGWNWYSDRSAGGGVIGALGTHAFDILAWLIGPVGSVQALNKVSIGKRPGLDGRMVSVDAEDVSLIQTTLQWEGSSVCSVPAQITLASVARNGRGCWFEVYGSEGSLILGSENQKDYVHGFTLWHAASGESLRHIQPDTDLAFSTTWSDGRVAPVARVQSWWAQSIYSGKPMVPGLMEGIASRLCCDAAATN